MRCTTSGCASRLSRCPDVCRDEAPKHSEQPDVSPYLWMSDYEMYFLLFSVIGAPVNSFGFLGASVKFVNAFCCHCFLAVRL